MKGKTIAYTADDQWIHPLTHMQAAEAAMCIHEGTLVLYGCADEIDAAAREGRELDLLTRARMRLDCAEGVRRCLDGVEILFHASGSSGIRLSSPLTRAVADLRAINQHGLLNLEMNRRLYGRVLLRDRAEHAVDLSRCVSISGAPATTGLSMVPTLDLDPHVHARVEAARRVHHEADACGRAGRDIVPGAG